MPTVVGELKPGFTVNLPLGVALAALPIVAVASMPRLERIAAGALWCAGLTVYALVFKGIGPWWWCCTPMVVVLLRARVPISTRSMQWAYAMLLAAAVASLSISNVRLYASLAPYEKGGAERSLPSIKAFDAEPLAAWLEQHLRSGARGRLLTTFAYGSYMQWRVPSLSESIDSRGIFPDSAALPDAVGRPGVNLGPWRSADVAVVPVNYPVAAVLDTSAEWYRVGVARKAPWSTSASPAGLWLRRGWWAGAGRASTSTQNSGVP